MVILMNKILLILLSVIIYINASDNNYTFLVNKYNKEIELEAKIMSNIVHDMNLSPKPSIFIPNISQVERNIYAELFTISDNCNDANFIFIKSDKIEEFQECEKLKNKIFFTNNYDLLLKNNHFIGAFFWSKSRPNIVFVKNRLVSNNIKLPENYDKFIEEF